jgi:hypothetical protein
MPSSTARSRAFAGVADRRPSLQAFIGIGAIWRLRQTHGRGPLGARTKFPIELQSPTSTRLPFLAPNRHAAAVASCLLLGEDRAWLGCALRSQFDPEVEILLKVAKAICTVGALYNLKRTHLLFQQFCGGWRHP